MAVSTLLTASLPMYDLPEVRPAVDALWSALAANLRRNGFADVPDRVCHGRAVRELWADPNLLISQCCGYDVVSRYRGRLKPIATPVFAAPGCTAQNYSSTVVVRDDCRHSDVREMFGATAAINGPESHSGMSSLRHLVAGQQTNGQFFTDIKVSGSHIASLDLIRTGAADVAAIDSVTVALLRRHRSSALSGIRVLGTTYSAPAPPYVIKSALSDNEAAGIIDALLRTFSDPSTEDYREQLLLTGITPARQEDYWVLEAFEDYASKQGLPALP